MQDFPDSISNKSSTKSSLFGYLLFLTFVFILLEISFFIQRNGLYLGDFKMISSHLKMPLAILPGVIFFLGVQLLIHVVFTVIVWLAALWIAEALDYNAKKTLFLGFALWGLALLTVILANQVYFLNSHFCDLLGVILNFRAAHFLLLVALVFCAVAAVLASIGLGKILMRKMPLLSRAIMGLIFLTSTASFIEHRQHEVVDAATKTKPNIILIGVDSLRPDFLGYFSGKTALTPLMDTFLNGATVFGQAITPQARTFPAWVGILTGQYSKLNGARYDLADLSELHLDNNTLPQILREHGYKTIFATDETRFSNIDENFGFDKLITPPIGFNDFLLGTINDFPMSNLLVNTALGKWLFPYSYANRAVYVTYDPNSFLNLLQPELAKSRDKPLFLAVHFCLPHFPYFWKSYSYRDTSRAVPHYEAAVKRTDKQVADFILMLGRNGLLKHSIVVLLSDHGEAMELDGDRATESDLFVPGVDPKPPHFYLTSFDFEKINQSAGHGTDVLSMTQYHSVLAFRLFGMDKMQPGVVADTVSLLDIKPTILSLLGIDAGANDNGSSLANYIMADNTMPQALPNDLFLESDFSPQAVHSAYPETRKLLFQGIDFFVINPHTTRLTVKKSMGAMIIASKQYADIYGPWVLALYPQEKGGMMPILVSLDSGEWTNDLRTPFALGSPAAHMLSALQKFYGSEISTVENIPAV